jgi:hypothetical protein
MREYNTGQTFVKGKFWKVWKKFGLVVGGCKLLLGQWLRGAVGFEKS